MNIETTGLGTGSYPEPKDDFKSIKAKVHISFDLYYDVPARWDKEKATEDVKQNLHDFEWYDEQIEEVEVEIDG